MRLLLQKRGWWGGGKGQRYGGGGWIGISWCVSVCKERERKWGDKKGAHIGDRADQTQLPWQQMEADAGAGEVKKKRGVGCLIIKYQMLYLRVIKQMLMETTKPFKTCTQVVTHIYCTQRLYCYIIDIYVCFSLLPMQCWMIKQKVNK